MGWEEKYGGIWAGVLMPGEMPVAETHLADRHLVALIARRPDGLYRAVVLGHRPDPQWRVPFWGEVTAPAMASSIDDAELYLVAALANLVERGS
ncbi:hypothetical protein [Burkholderia sp. Ac-20392]|uniref:hypothetical protein n=1 Tax=Burkholderia sp. Ac-20392 TaxID=2703905 RepID=UPI00197FD5A1|nr:hypothetical protein [Burkholderia sp. Ac-20392]MBN3793825.1 hypothetical protein [Burkholderia sp. Ac-20392]